MLLLILGFSHETHLFYMWAKYTQLAAPRFVFIAALNGQDLKEDAKDKQYS